MDTTLNISLGGSAFIIEEIAYIKLNQYLAKVKSHLGDNFDTSEIINDIEQRMAELLLLRLEARRVINSTDVQYLIDTLGLPEQYIQNEATTASPTTTVGKAKLFRDMRGKKLAGVFSGLAYFWQIDPLWLRLVFVALLLFSSQSSGVVAVSAGAWLLLYGLLWVLVPAAQTTSDYLQMQGKSVNIDSISEYENHPPVPKMFYRSATNKKIAGVLGAISPMVGIDVLWLRIGFSLAALGLVPFLTALSGLLVCAYLLIWLFAPIEGEKVEEEINITSIFFKTLLLCLGFVLLFCFFAGFFMLATLVFVQVPQLHSLLGNNFSIIADISNIGNPTWIWTSLIGGTVFAFLALVFILYVLRK